MVAATELCSLITLPYVVSFIIQAIIGLLAPTALLFAMFGRTREAQEAVSIAKRVGSKLAGKLHRA
jgi:ABC-type Na+ efflux pump permease subunit